MSKNDLYYFVEYYKQATILFFEQIFTQKNNKKTMISEDPDEYKDYSGKFQSIGLILTVVGIAYLISQIDFPSWLQDLFSNILFWIGLAVVILLFIFRKKVLPKLNWNWLWAIPVLALAYFIWFQWKSGEIKKEYHRPNVVITTEPEPVDLSSYEELIIGADNSFEAGKWKKFKFKASNTSEQKYLNFYTAIGSYDPVVLTFKQVSTGKIWQWKIYRDAYGNPQSDLLYGTPQVFIGDCLVHSDRTADVLVLIE